MTYDVLICFFFCHPHHEPSEMPQPLCHRASPAFGVRVDAKTFFLSRNVVLLIEKRRVARQDTLKWRM